MMFDDEDSWSDQLEPGLVKFDEAPWTWQRKPIRRVPLLIPMPRVAPDSLPAPERQDPSDRPAA